MTQNEIAIELKRLAQEIENGMPPQDWDASTLLTRLKDATSNVTLHELSGRTGINTSNLSLILQGKRVPRLDTFVSIAKAVGMEIECREQ